MKNNMKYLLLAILFIGVIVSAVVLYPKLTEKYGTQNELSDTADSESIETATDFTVYDADENAVKLSDFVGKPTVVNFWTTWCRYCVDEMPTFEKYASEYKDKVNFLMVNLTGDYGETKKGALDFIKTQGYTFPVYFDTTNSAAKAYRVQSIPMTLLIDKDGKLYKTHTGILNETTLKNYLEILTGGKGE